MNDTRFEPALFRDAAVAPDTAKLNAELIELLTGQPEWWIVGAEAMRAARRRGDGPFPAPVSRAKREPSRSPARPATKSRCA